MIEKIIIINQHSQYYLHSGTILILNNRGAKVKISSTNEEMWFFLSELGEI